MKTVLKRVIMISGKVNKSNESIVDFGIKRLYGFVVDLAWVLTVSFAFKNVLAGLLYYLGYSFLRIYAGGYHAKTEKMCYILSYLSLALSLFLLFICRIPEKIILDGAIFCYLLILLFSPFEHKNRPLSKKEFKIFRLRVYLISTIEIVLFMIFIYTDLKIYAKSIFVALFFVASTLLAAIYEKTKGEDANDKNWNM